MEIDSSDDDNDSLFSNISTFIYNYHHQEKNDDNEDNSIESIESIESIDKNGKDNLRMQLLSIYSFLRTLSLDLHIAPFDVELFMDCILTNESSITDSELYEPVQDDLISEIHYQLILVCLSLLQFTDIQPWWQVAWSLFDRTNWSEYLLPIFQLWMNDHGDGSGNHNRDFDHNEYDDRNHNLNNYNRNSNHDDNIVLSTCDDVCQHLSRYVNHGYSYHNCSSYLKVKILQTFVIIIQSSNVISFVMEQRETKVKNDDPFPLFKKGSDGYPDVCILCSEGGDLLCCEYCPGSYHRSCLYELNPNVFDGEWQCYECSIPDPLIGRGKLNWNICKSGYISIVGNILICKPYAKSSIFDYIELGYENIPDLLPKISFNQLLWKQFVFYMGKLIRRGWYYLDKNRLIEDDENDSDEEKEDDNEMMIGDGSLFAEDISIKEFSTLSSDDDYNNIDIDNSDDDDSYGLSSGNNNGRRKRNLQSLELKLKLSSKHDQNKVFMSKNKSRPKKSNDLQRTYIRIDEMLQLNSTCNFTLPEMKKIVEFKGVNRRIIKYHNHYKDAKGSTTFHDLRSQLIVSKIGITSIKRSIESIYDAIGTLNGISNVITLPFKDNSWIIRLLNSKSLSTLGKILYDLANKADIKAFRTAWYLSPLELESHRLGRISTFKLVNEESRYRRSHIRKSSIIRFFEFVSINTRTIKSNHPTICSNSNISSSNSNNNDNNSNNRYSNHKKHHPTHLSSPVVHDKNNKILSNNSSYDNDDDDDSDREENEFQKMKRNNNSNNNLNDDNDENDEKVHNPIKQERGYELTEFQTGRKLLSFNERCHIPKRYLRKLGRIGGIGFIPLVVYVLQPNIFASPPFYWYWNYRILHTKSVQGLALHVRYLEEALIDNIQNRICLQQKTSLEHASYFLDPSILGFISKEKKKKRKTTTLSRYHKIYNKIMNSSLILSNKLFINVKDKVDRADKDDKEDGLSFSSNSTSHYYHSSVMKRVLSKLQTEPNISELEIISSNNEIHGEVKNDNDLSISMLSSYRLRTWLESILSKTSISSSSSSSSSSWPHSHSITTMDDCSRFCQFVNTIYDLVSQSGYSENDEMMIYKEVHFAIQLEKINVRKDLIYLLSLSISKSKIIHLAAIPNIVDHLIDKSILAVTELVKFDFASSLNQSQPIESIRRSNRNRQEVKIDVIDNSHNDKNENEVESVSELKLDFTSLYDIPTEDGPLMYLYEIFRIPDILKQKKKSNSSYIETNFYKPRVMQRKDVVWIDSSYCFVTNPVSTIYYLPQVGDELIYYVNGHKEYVTIYPDGNRIDRNGLIKKQLELNCGICCKILTIDYEFPLTPTTGDKGIQLILQLAVCNGQPFVPVKTFVVSYRPQHTSAEFLILRETIEASLKLNWKLDMEFSMVYEGGQRFEGKIISIDRDIHEISTWAGVTVYWNSWGEDRVNEWELEMIPKIMDVKTIPRKTRVKSVSKSYDENQNISNGSKITMTSSTDTSLDILTKKNSSLEKIRQSINKILLNIVIKFINKTEFEAFREYIDDSVAPDYSCYIPFQMNLSLMRDRAKSNYYRQPQGLLGDTRTLFVNCSYYNLEQSPLTLAAANLYRSILRELTSQFPNTSFHDYTLFDRCLGNKLSVFSLLDGCSKLISS